MRVDPYAHPQHIMVVKHFVYIQYGCGMHSTGGLSFNHVITTLLRLRSNLHRHYSVRVYPYAHPQHIMVVKHFVYIQYGCGMHFMGGLIFSHDIILSLRLRSSTPISPKIHPQSAQALQCKGGPTCTFTAYHDGKTFAYIQYGCGMHSMVGLCLSHDITTSLRLRSTPISPKNPPPTCTGITV